MQITATELKNNLGKYLALAEQEDIQITKNGRSTVKLSGTNKERLNRVRSVYGTLSNDISLDQARMEMLTRKLGYEVWEFY